MNDLTDLKIGGWIDTFSFFVSKKWFVWLEHEGNSAPTNAGAIQLMFPSIYRKKNVKMANLGWVRPVKFFCSYFGHLHVHR